MAKWIIVVDDDTSNLQVAGSILSRNNMRVTALKSGRKLIEYIGEGNVPDLILLDILMPEMDGHETFKKLRAKEEELGIPAIPVVFLTADESTETESRSLDAGAADFIRKPFDPDALVKRVEKILGNEEKIQQLTEEASVDQLTDLYNKVTIHRLIANELPQRTGALLIIDLDFFKQVNDIYGHESGDRVLVAFSEMLQKNMRQEDMVGRIGGDEFMAYISDSDSPASIAGLCSRLNEGVDALAKEILGDDFNLPLGVSIGAVFVREKGARFEEEFKKADEALYNVKRNGKHNYDIYGEVNEVESVKNAEFGDIQKISMMLEERSKSNYALWLGHDAFSSIYRFMVRYIQSYHGDAFKVLFTVEPVKEVDDDYAKMLIRSFGDMLNRSLRKSDIMMQIGFNKFFLLLPEVKAQYIEGVTKRIIVEWNNSALGDEANILCQSEAVEHDEEESGERKGDIVIKPEKNEMPWVVIVDDDNSNRIIAEHILTQHNIKVTVLESGHALIDFISENRPDLILLDILMPDMDGFETFRLLREKERILMTEDIPVIYLTANDNEEIEAKCLREGAMDFIKKPFIPEVLMLRVQHILELRRLQRNLESEVEVKTKENEALSLHVIRTLAEAIDAKDTYTNGHSGRVAEYSRMIAERAGYSKAKAEEIYMIALLHDIGKIGVPDAVINKPGKLNEEEFAQIKKHPVMGAKILENISELPKLAVGAKYHHERFGGGGYPEGINGNGIPEEARIIAVADAYDAMSSRRSYRDILPQKAVREEIEKGLGTQFDPKFASIMLSMIDEDAEYGMKEQ
ncbi:MAG: response regulator [Lachnospiraceae bacterium]|nr:response regulator [Lachnospiraceae bacterium]